ncbi:MAG: hypothetical protein K1X50_15490 [Candidatus Promineofilum sp.]|nr:hypothetical protein [Promineifilum sp.]MCW5864799.1 hypothetical protein [Anaerolineae bacterium]
MNPLRIVLVGHSVLLDTVAVGLRRFPDIEIIPLPAPPLGMEPLAALRPDVILFDVGADFPQCAFVLLQRRPGLRLIGLDADRNRAVVWSRQQLNELSLGELAAILAGNNPAPPQATNESP